MSKKINKTRGPLIMDLDIPMRDSVGGAHGELEKIKKKAEPAETKAAEKTEPVKPVENVGLSDEAREKLLATFIDKFRTQRRVGFNELALSIGGLDDKNESQVRSFLAQLEKDGEIRESEKNELGWEAYEFTERGLAKYADLILGEGSHEGILANFIDSLKTGQEVNAEVLVGRWIGCPGEADAFLAHMLEIGELRKIDDGKYQFTEAGLDKYADRLLWYPAFRLTFNPFSTFDAGAEHRADLSVPLITEKYCVPMVGRVKSLFAARTSAIIEGERGCGKTSIVVHFEIGGEDRTTLVSPHNVQTIKNAMNRRVASKIGLKGAKIVLGVRGGYASEEEIEQYRKAVAEVGQRGYLSDVPDNISHKGAFELADLCGRILDEGGFVILLATLEQARMLKRLDMFARFPIIKFEHPSKEFFRPLFAGRLETASIIKPPKPPLSDGAIDRVAEAADCNPRRFILLCGHLLTEMRERGVDKPIDEKMADELLKDKDVLAEAPIDVTEALQAIMRDFGSKGAGWVKLRIIRGVLAERYGLDLRPETLGRRLTEMGYQRRYAPSAEYLAPG